MSPQKQAAEVIGVLLTIILILVAALIAKHRHRAPPECEWQFFSPPSGDGHHNLIVKCDGAEVVNIELDADISLRTVKSTKGGE